MKTPNKIGSIMVTEQSIRTPRKTLRLNNLENIRLMRPGLPIVGILAALCVGLASTFEDILYAHEFWALLVVPVLLLPVAAQFGVLRLEYHGLGGSGSLTGRYGHLRLVRAAIDVALNDGAS